MPRQREVPCRYGCGKKFPYRSRMEKHLAKCPNRPECTPARNDTHVLQMLLDLQDRFNDYRLKTDKRIATIERINRRLREEASQTSLPECFDTRKWIENDFLPYDTVESLHDNDRNMVKNFDTLFNRIRKDVFDFPIIMLNLALSSTQFIRRCSKSQDHVYVNVIFPDRTMSGRHSKRSFVEAWHVFSHYELGEWFLTDKMTSEAHFSKVPYNHLTHEYKILIRKIDLRMAKKIARDRVPSMVLQQDKRDLVSQETKIKQTYAQLIGKLITNLNELI